MDTDALTPELLRKLREPKAYPAVSLTMPTHRREPEIGQDAVRLRNLMAEAGRRLDADDSISRQARLGIKAQLEKAADDIDLRRFLDGLAIFAGADDHQLWTLPRSVPERVVLSDSYLTRNLVSAKAQARPYWVLVVAADRATLWSGSETSVRQHTGGGFPKVLPQEPPNPQREERQGDTASTFTDETTRQFMRDVDNAIAAVLAAEPRPLFLVGLAPALALLEEASTAARPLSPAARLVKGGLTDGPAPELLKELRPALDEYRRAEASRVEERLDAAIGRHAFAAGLDEVWQSVGEGRAGLVVVEEHYQRTVRVDGGHLRPADDSEVTDPAVREDIVDELVERALDRGAEVVFVPDDELKSHDRVAAELRF
ncbi:chemotaxis protein [Streptomyces sp. NPDC006283]|uniref:baeRF3 domain-containing protein n=1 Tax=Streptomyces sp. NPDC006283 TaxID=3156741 RepID=UPI0033ADFB64